MNDYNCASDEYEHVQRWARSALPRINSPPPPPPPTIKNGWCLNVRISVTSKVSSNVFSISEKKKVPVHDYEKRYAEAFAITKIWTFKHKPFFIVGGGGLFVVFLRYTVHSYSLFIEITIVQPEQVLLSHSKGCRVTRQ